MKRMFVRCIVLLILCSAASPMFPADAVRGVIAHRISGCDYFLVETANGYDLLEWYGDYDPDEGDTLVGDYESYGFHNVVDETADETTHVYTEDYQLSKSDALEQLVNQCK